MNKKNYLPIVLVAVVIIAGIFLYRQAKKNADKRISAVPGAEIPDAVLKEPVADWIGDTLTYQGIKYTPMNGQWVRVS